MEMIKNYSLKDAFKALDEINDELIETSVVISGPLNESYNELKEDIDKANIRAFDINWETDGEEVELPSEFYLELDEDEINEDDAILEDIIADKLSDETGWLVNSFSFEKIDPKEVVIESKELNEDVFSLSNEDGLKEIEEFKEEEDNEVPELKIVDTNANDIDEVASNEEVAGSFVFTCDKCGQSIFRTLDELKDAGYERLDDTERSQFKLKNKNMSDGEFYRCNKCGCEIWNGDKQIVLADVDKEVKGEEIVPEEPVSQEDVIPEEPVRPEEAEEVLAVESLQENVEDKKLTEDDEVTEDDIVEDYLSDRIERILNKHEILWGDIVEYPEHKKCNIVGVPEEEWENVRDILTDELHMEVILPSEDHDEYDDEIEVFEECLKEALSVDKIEEFKKHEFFKEFSNLLIRKLISIYLDFNGGKEESVTPEEVFEFINEEGCGLFALDNMDALKFVNFKQLALKDPKFIEACKKYYPEGFDGDDDSGLEATFKKFSGDDLEEIRNEVKKIYLNLDESVEEELPEYDDVTITDIDESSIDEAISSKLSQMFENFASYKTETAVLKDVENRIVLEGNLTFTSNKEQKVTFILEAVESDNSNIKFKLLSESFEDINAEIDTTLNEGLLEAKKKVNLTEGVSADDPGVVDAYAFLENNSDGYAFVTQIRTDKGSKQINKGFKSDSELRKFLKEFEDEINAKGEEVRDISCMYQGQQGNYRSIISKKESLHESDDDKNPEECSSLEEYSDFGLSDLEYNIRQDSILDAENISEDDERDWTNDADGYVANICSIAAWGGPTSNEAEKSLLLDYIERKYPSKLRVLRRYFGNDQSSVKPLSQRDTIIEEK